MSDDNTPMGTVEIAALVGLPVATISQWDRRGHLRPARWIVSGRHAWSLADVRAMLEEIHVHRWAGSFERCGGHACSACSMGVARVPLSAVVPLEVGP